MKYRHMQIASLIVAYIKVPHIWQLRRFRRLYLNSMDAMIDAYAEAYMMERVNRL